MRKAEVFPFAICIFLLLVVTNLIVLAAPASASARALVHEEKSTVSIPKTGRPGHAGCGRYPLGPCIPYTRPPNPRQKCGPFSRSRSCPP